MRPDPGELLRQHGLRVTPQRRAILAVFQGSGDEHLSADEVHARATAVVPEISRGTVYATLAELTELELLAAVGQPEPVRYEVNTELHDHFRCRVCLRLFDVALGGQELAARPLPGYAIESVAVRAEGVCHECRDYDRGLRDGVRDVQRKASLRPEQFESLACRRYNSPIGPLGLAASTAGIVRVASESHADFDSLISRARSRRGAAAARERLDQLIDGLEQYFAGGSDQLTNAMDPVLRTPQNMEALRATRRIPASQSRSYHRLELTMSAFDCGYTMGSNPVPLLCPCHRVTRGSQRPDVYVGGAEQLRLLQQLEANQHTQD